MQIRLKPHFEAKFIVFDSSSPFISLSLVHLQYFFQNECFKKDLVTHKGLLFTNIKTQSVAACSGNASVRVGWPYLYLEREGRGRKHLQNSLETKTSSSFCRTSTDHLLDKEKTSACRRQLVPITAHFKHIKVGRDNIV